MNKTSVGWVYPALFYGIAFTLSLPFNSASLAGTLPLRTLIAPAWQSWMFLPAALGPLIGAIVCYRLDRSTIRRMTLLGNDPVASFLIALLPVVVFMVADSLRAGLKGGLYAGATASLALVYALGEEAGWRGYLQDALRPLRAPLRYLIVGVLWWAWHARFATFFDGTLFLLIVVASAFLLGHVAQETRSLLMVASMHSAIMLLTMGGSPGLYHSVAGGVIVLGWILIRVFRPSKAEDRVNPHPYQKS